MLIKSAPGCRATYDLLICNIGWYSRALLPSKNKATYYNYSGTSITALLVTLQQSFMNGLQCVIYIYLSISPRSNAIVIVVFHRKKHLTSHVLPGSLQWYLPNSFFARYSLTELFLKSCHCCLSALFHSKGLPTKTQS